MILQAILTPFFLLLSFIASLLPTASVIAIPVQVLQFITYAITISAYFLPVGDFLLMLGIWLGLIGFNFTWKFLWRIWDALPLT